MDKLVFVIPEKARGWILEGICKEIEKFYSGETGYCYDTRKVPESDAYFYAHYAFYLSAIKRNPDLLKKKNFIWYTHPRELKESKEELIEKLNQSTKVIATNSKFAAMLVDDGLSPDKATYVLGGADPEMFKPNSEDRNLKGVFKFFHPLHGLDLNKKVIGFCSAYYDRKNPELIIDIIKEFKDCSFIILGKDWDKAPQYPELKKLKNLKIVQVPYEKYPEYYSKMDVFISPSKLEGGPIPLVEAMMMGVVPVASTTGFAEDIIKEGSNGFLFNIEDSRDDIFNKVRAALDFKADIRDSVRNLSWEQFSKSIEALV